MKILLILTICVLTLSSSPSIATAEQYCVQKQSSDGQEEYTCTKNPLKDLFPEIYKENDELLTNNEDIDPSDPFEPIYDDEDITKDIMRYRLKILSKVINLGAKQRISGSVSEQKSVVRVLYKMEQYIWNEILSKKQRFKNGTLMSQCKNENELCAFWASVGECDSNRGFMLVNCAASCRLCMLLYANFD